MCKRYPCGIQMSITNSNINLYTNIFRTLAERFLIHPIKMDFKLLL